MPVSIQWINPGGFFTGASFFPRNRIATGELRRGVAACGLRHRAQDPWIPDRSSSAMVGCMAPSGRALESGPYRFCVKTWYVASY
jgi:hypothetical protein